MRLLSICIALFIFVGCEKKENLPNPLELGQNEGIFYLLDDEKGVKFYLRVEKNPQNISELVLNGAFTNSKDDFVGLMSENNFSVVLEKISGVAFDASDSIVLDVSFDKKNRPTINAHFEDGTRTFSLSKQKLHHLMFSNKSVKEGDISLNYERCFIPSSAKLGDNVIRKINEQILNSQEPQKLKDMEKGELQRWFVPIFIDDEILNLAVMDYEFTGGAHGISNRSSLIFSLKTGEVLSSQSDDLFSNADDKALLELLLDKLGEYDKTSEFHNEQGVGRFIDWDEKNKEFVSLPSEFFIFDKGIEFVFKPYEIASYAEGYISIRFEFRELKPFVDKNSPLSFLFE